MDSGPALIPSTSSRHSPAWQGLGFGVGMITEAATAIEHGMAEVVMPTPNPSPCHAGPSRRS
ncbi:hypothetical protein MAHJHV54_47730 [Mycobacterium avium subsp. hominissuis]